MSDVKFSYELEELQEDEEDPRSPLILDARRISRPSPVSNLSVHVASLKSILKSPLPQNKSEAAPHLCSTVSVPAVPTAPPLPPEGEDPRPSFTLESNSDPKVSPVFINPRSSPGYAESRYNLHGAPALFLTVPFPGPTSPLPSPIIPSSTPLPVHHSVSFYDQPGIEQSQSISRQVDNNDNTTYKKSRYLSDLLLVLTDAILPLVSIVFTLVNVLQLFFMGQFDLCVVGLVVFNCPTLLILFYYLENMFHREKKLLEMGLIIIFGPFLRWILSVRLLGEKFHPTAADVTDLEKFAFSVKVVDGIFQTSIAIIWLLFLIAIGVHPLPVLGPKMTNVTDMFGNSIEIPDISTVSLYSSVAVLVKNLCQLWMIHYPVSTDQEGNVTILHKPKAEGLMISFSRFLLLILFTSTGVLYRLMCYTMLFIHLNIFKIPAVGIMILSTLLHIVLRGVSNKFYVEISSMDVFLTACCCSLVPTPTSSNIKAHNLLQAHNAITNTLLLIAVIFCTFFNIDYSVPIVRRYNALEYSSDFFFNGCLATVSLLPVSTFFYLLYKNTMGFPGFVRRTIFWRNRSPTTISVITGLVFIILLGSLGGLNYVGRESSKYCEKNSTFVKHGSLLPDATGFGSRLKCHGTYIPYPEPVIYCRRFFGQDGIIDIKPLYIDELKRAQSATADKVKFLKDMSSLACRKSISFCKSDEAMFNTTALPETTTALPETTAALPETTTALPETPVDPHGSWHRTETVCALFCETGYLSTGAPFPCTARDQVPSYYCHPASLVFTNLSGTYKPSFYNPDDDNDDDDDDDDDNEGDDSCIFKHKTSPPDDPVFLCRTPADILNNDCQVLNKSDQNKISFTDLDNSDSETRYTLVSYKYSTDWLLHNSNHALIASEPSVQLDKDCVVKISHDSLMIIGNETLLIKYTGPGTTMTYWKLHPLHTPRYYHACALLDQGWVLVAGGKVVRHEDKWVVQTELININGAVGMWRKVGDIAVPRVHGRILTVDGGCPLLVGGSGKDGDYLAVEKFYLHHSKEDGIWTDLSVNKTLGKSVFWSANICSGDICRTFTTEATTSFTIDLEDIHIYTTESPTSTVSAGTIEYRRESANNIELGFTSTRSSKVLTTETAPIFTMDFEDLHIYTTESPTTNVSTGTTEYRREIESFSELGSKRPSRVLLATEATANFTIDLGDIQVYAIDSPTSNMSTGTTPQSPKYTQHNKAEGNLVLAGREDFQSTTQYRRESTSHSEISFTQPSDNLAIKATTEIIIFTVNLEDLHTTESPTIMELDSLPQVHSQSTSKDSQHTDDIIEDVFVIETGDGETEKRK